MINPSKAKHRTYSEWHRYTSESMVDESKKCTRFFQSMTTKGRHKEHTTRKRRSQTSSSKIFRPLSSIDIKYALMKGLKDGGDDKKGRGMEEERIIEIIKSFYLSSGLSSCLGLCGHRPLQLDRESDVFSVEENGKWLITGAFSMVKIALQLIHFFITGRTIQDNEEKSRKNALRASILQQTDLF